jgi:hypothetical protein
MLSAEETGLPPARKARHSRPKLPFLFEYDFCLHERPFAVHNGWLAG